MLTIEKSFDWATFAARYWDRRPVLYKAVGSAPFAEKDVFRAAVRASPPPAAMAQFTVERSQQPDPGDLLPQGEDGSFDGYDARLTARLDGRRYALIINGFHSFDPALWTRERAFYAGLWEQVGLPLTGAITTLFHGTYEHSPVGVHKDRFATFMFGLRGHKRMRFWTERPWSEPVSTVLDYQPYVPESFAAEVEPGDLLYWPASYYHVGESAGSGPATSVNVGVPREEHHAGYDLQDVLVGVDAALMGGRDGALAARRLPPVDAALTAPGPDDTGRLAPDLPPALRHAVPAVPPDRVGEVSLRRWTACGFEPVPAPAAHRTILDDTVVRGDVRFPVLWDGNGRCAVNGHTVRTPFSPDDLRTILSPLSSGDPVRVGDLPATEEVRRLLVSLESFRGITRVD
ncbi:JmjC domain-containing protein [Actinoallomurus sp. CA-150999]|uniref:JmjC domain-containing protein n=1 Tax=Actinoallomurus sp. CA-150999 TaxID=3239887 RepID=UPI003D8AE96B